MPTNIAQVQLRVLCGSNGTFTEPLTNSFLPPPAVLNPVAKSIKGSVTFTQGDAFKPGPSDPTNMAYKSSEAQSYPAPNSVPGGIGGAIINTSISVQNTDTAATCYLQTREYYLGNFSPGPIYIPILPGGIVQLTGPFDAGFLVFMSPALGVSIDYLLVGYYPTTPLIQGPQ